MPGLALVQLLQHGAWGELVEGHHQAPGGCRRARPLPQGPGEDLLHGLGLADRQADQEAGVSHRPKLFAPLRQGQRQRPMDPIEARRRDLIHSLARDALLFVHELVRDLPKSCVGDATQAQCLRQPVRNLGSPRLLGARLIARRRHGEAHGRRENRAKRLQDRLSSS